MQRWWPSYAELSADVEPARWIMESFLPWGSARPPTVGSFLPPGYEAYAR